ncbi:Uncharacterized protein Fot_57174 [Forsythia ovata]|uniref:Uncharacterized protein n=1 Tax=Forsythia ovata TaxID=205694 RepID=A0ABD1NWF9_9LAMI
MPKAIKKRLNLVGSNSIFESWNEAAEGEKRKGKMNGSENARLGKVKRESAMKMHLLMGEYEEFDGILFTRWHRKRRYLKFTSCVPTICMDAENIPSNSRRQHLSLKPGFNAIHRNAGNEFRSLARSVYEVEAGAADCSISSSMSSGSKK